MNHSQPNHSEGIAVVFPGQVFDAEVIEATLRPFAGEPLVRRLTELTQTTDWSTLDMSDARVAGPCTLVAGLLSAEAAIDRSSVVATAGHSFGEITAMCYAGAIKVSDALRIVSARGRASRMASNRRPGTMAAIIGVEAFTVERLRRTAVARTRQLLEIGSSNESTQTVVTGDIAAVDLMEQLVAGCGGLTVRLPIPGAYHSPSMWSALPILGKAVDITDFTDPELPLYSAIDGRRHETAAGLGDLIVAGLIMPVRWQTVMERLIADGIGTAFAAGPGDTLEKIGRRYRELSFVSPVVGVAS